MPLSQAQIQQFKIDGYLVLPSILGKKSVAQLRALTLSHLDKRVAPFELEADVKYPGAPSSKVAKGGATIRRLTMAYQRDPILAALAKQPDVISGIGQILGCDQLLLNPNHHNCVMTKQPTYSSETLWHRDTRYWNFDNKYLINAWFALGNETEANGAMKILPGSHRWEVQDDALDADQFLILEHPDNQARLATQRLLPLAAGDALLFSAHCFHAAGKNTTDQAKFSAVFTYHCPTTKAITGTNSATHPAISLKEPLIKSMIPLAFKLFCNQGIFTKA